MREERYDSKKANYLLKKNYIDIIIFAEEPKEKKVQSSIKDLKSCKVMFYQEKKFLISIKSNVASSQVYVFPIINE